MKNKWKKLNILIDWLKLGNSLKVGSYIFNLSTKENIMVMINDVRGIELQTLDQIFTLLKLIPKKQFKLMKNETNLIKNKKK